MGYLLATLTFLTETLNILIALGKTPLAEGHSTVGTDIL